MKPLADGPTTRSHQGDASLLTWALLFLLVALVAAMFGFGGLAVTATGVARGISFVFLGLFLLALAGYAYRPLR